MNLKILQTGSIIQLIKENNKDYERNISMKKIIAILLALVIVTFSFAACNKEESKDPNADNPYKPVEEFNEDKLKETWSAGEITFANGNKITIPCTVAEFIEKSGLKPGAAAQYENKLIKVGERFSLVLNGEDNIRSL